MANVSELRASCIRVNLEESEFFSAANFSVTHNNIVKGALKFSAR